MIDCRTVLDKCKSECCQMVPIPIEILRSQKDLASKSKLIPFNKHKAIVQTEEGYCAFSDRETGLCKIYNERPEICKKYGNEEHEWLTCKWMKDKN